MAKEVTTKIETYKLTAYNDMGQATCSLQLKVVVGQCKADGQMFKPTVVGETFVYDCAQENNLGKITRTCKMGKNEPEWGPTIGMCINLTTIIVLGGLLVVVVIIVVIALLKVASDKKKANARRGVKGGKKALNIMKSVPYNKI